MAKKPVVEKYRLGALARIGARLDSVIGKLPRPVRFLFDAGRIFGSLKGVAGLYTAIATMIADGVVLAVVQGMPVVSQALILGGTTLLVVLIAGHLAAVLRSRSGYVRFMTDRHFQRHVDQLATDIAEYIMTTGVIRHEMTRASLYRKITLRDPDITPGVFSGLKSPSRSRAVLYGDGVSALQEAYRRRFISAKTYKQCRDTKDLDGVLRGLNAVLTMIPVTSGLSSDPMPSDAHNEAPSRPQDES